MQFVVASEIFTRFPGMRIGLAVAAEVDNVTARPAVAGAWREAWEAAGREGAAYGNAQSHPRVRPWRERFRVMGISSKDFPSSIEAMLRRAIKGGDPFANNPLVDFYNAVSLRHVVPAGGFDLDHVPGPLELRLTRAGDRFTALDAGAPAEVSPGEVAYVDGTTVLTRHFVWRQAREALITPATRTLVLVSEVLGEAEGGGGGSAVVEAVLAEFETGLREHFGVEARVFVVDEAGPAVEW